MKHIQCCQQCPMGFSSISHFTIMRFGQVILIPYNYYKITHPIIPLGWSRQYGTIPSKPIVNTFIPMYPFILLHHWEGTDNMG